MRSTNSRLHLGNYEGALRNWVELQNEGFEMFCMVADLHALTTDYENPAQISKNGREIAKDYIAAGIDPAKSAIFVQSHVKEHFELHLLFSMITPLGWLERTPTYKEKVQDLRKGERSAILQSRLHSDQLDRTVRHLMQMLNAIAHGQGLDERRIDALVELSRRLTNELSQVRHVDQSNKSDEWYRLIGVLMTVRSSVLNLSRSLKGHERIPSRESLLEAIEESLESIRSTLEVPIPYGLLGYPVLQTADILLYKPYGVPVGRDQAPHLEIGNDIGQRFNRLYGSDVFPKFKYLIPEDETRAKVPGTDADDNGKLRKMSKSYDNCIYLADSEDEIAEKIKSAFTTPTKLRKTDPGVPEGCAVCQLLKLYSPDWQTQWAEDRAGERGCMQNKKELTEALNEFLRPMRQRRKEIDDAEIEEILRTGANQARMVAASTMAEVREAMGLR